MELRLPNSTGVPASCYAYTGGKPFDTGRPTLVFVHGALHDHSVWTLLARWFAHHEFGVLALDLPGHGRSKGAPLASVEELGTWLLAVLDEIGAERAAFVGHSMGSLIALEAAAQAPLRATRLVMVGTAFPMKVSETLLTTARESPLAAIDMVNTLSHSSMAAKPSFPGPGSWLHGGNRALMRRTQAEQTLLNLFHHDFSVCDRYSGALDAAKRVQCPASLVLGAVDQMTNPKHSTGLATALGARVHTVKAGHALMTEAPDQVLRALRESLA